MVHVLILENWVSVSDERKCFRAFSLPSGQIWQLADIAYLLLLTWLCNTYVRGVSTARTSHLTWEWECAATQCIQTLDILSARLQCFFLLWPQQLSHYSLLVEAKLHNYKIRSTHGNVKEYSCNEFLLFKVESHPSSVLCTKIIWIKMQIRVNREMRSCQAQWKYI